MPNHTHRYELRYTDPIAMITYKNAIDIDNRECKDGELFVKRNLRMDFCLSIFHSLVERGIITEVTDA
jgi:hypothetical protein